MDRMEQSNGHSDSAKQSSFSVSYTTMCKEKNVPAHLELIKNKNKLDFVADRIKVDQWDMICKSLELDNLLEVLVIRSRKSNLLVNEQTGSEKRLNIMAPLIQSVSGCVKRNHVIVKLALEGLPLTANCVQTISNAVCRNCSLNTLSFARSSLMDEGCNIICSAARDLPHIEKLNLSQCYLTTTAAFYISELIKYQTINRNSEGWMKSLRYRDVDVDSVPGLKCLILNGNQFRDEGLELITSKLKEDMWMKAVEVQNCLITEVGGEAILDCLKFNKTLIVFDASHNFKISNKTHKKIQMMLSTEPDDYESAPKITNSELREKIEFLEQQLQLEVFNRERADELNIQLHESLVRCNEEIAQKLYEPPTGYKIIQSGDLNTLYKEIEDMTQEKANTKRANETEIKGNGSIRDQNGFGDSFSSTGRKTYASFIPFNKEPKIIELNTAVSFTPYSEESSCNISSKLDDDVTTVNSGDDEEFSARRKEEYVGFNQFNEEIFGDGKYE